MEEKKVVKKVVQKTENKEPFIEKLKRNWKNILLIILVLFSFSKCTSSCSKGRQIEKLNYQIEQMDSVIVSNGIEIDKLSMRLGDAQTSIDSYKGIAIGNQNELVDKISELTEANKKLTNDNERLKQKIKQLEKELLEVYD